MSTNLSSLLGYNLNQEKSNQSDDYLEDEKPQYADATTQLVNDAFKPIPMPPSPIAPKTEEKPQEPPKQDEISNNDLKIGNILKEELNKVEESQQNEQKSDDNQQKVDDTPETVENKEENNEIQNIDNSEQKSDPKTEDPPRDPETELNIDIKKLIPTLPPDEPEKPAENEKPQQENEVKQEEQPVTQEQNDKNANTTEIPKEPETKEEPIEKEQQDEVKDEVQEKPEETTQLVNEIKNIETKLEREINEQIPEEPKEETQPEEVKEEEPKEKEEEKVEEQKTENEKPEETQEKHEEKVEEPKLTLATEEIKEKLDEIVDENNNQQNEEKPEENHEEEEKKEKTEVLVEPVRDINAELQNVFLGKEKDDQESTKSSNSRQSSSRSKKSPLPPLQNDEEDEQNNTETFITTDETPFLFNIHQPNTFDKRQVEKAYNDFAKHGAPPPANLRPGIVQYINRKKATALMDSDYDAAEQLDQQMLELAKLGYDNPNDLHARLKNLENRSSDLQGEKRAMEEKWAEKMEKHEEECEQRLEKLKEKQLAELDDYKQKWQSQEFCRAFSKPSVRLLQLRHQEKKMALSRRYQDAKVQKRIADELQAQEERQAEALLEEAIRRELQTLREKHWREENKLREYNEKTRMEMEAQKSRELEPYDSAIKAIGHKKTEKPNPRFTKLPQSLTSAVAGQAAGSGPQPTIATPRTVTRMKQFRTEKKGNLNINPVDDETLSRAQKKSRMNPTPRGTAYGSRTTSAQPTRMNSPTRRPKTSDSKFPRL